MTPGRQAEPLPGHDAGQALRSAPGEPCRQAFLTKLTPSGSGASYSTYLGGREHDDAYGVAVDRDGQAHVTGSTQSPDFPTQNAFQATLDNRGCTSEQPKELCDDGFAIKLKPNGNPQWSTFLGGKDADRATGISADRHGSAHIAGRTLSPDFPTVRPFQPALKDTDYDAFVSFINNPPTRSVWPAGTISPSTARGAQVQLGWPA